MEQIVCINCRDGVNIQNAKFFARISSAFRSNIHQSPNSLETTGTVAQIDQLVAMFSDTPIDNEWLDSFDSISQLIELHTSLGLCNRSFLLDLIEEHLEREIHSHDNSHMRFVHVAKHLPEESAPRNQAERIELFIKLLAKMKEYPKVSLSDLNEVKNNYVSDLYAAYLAWHATRKGINVAIDEARFREFVGKYTLFKFEKFENPMPCVQRPWLLLNDLTSYFTYVQVCLK